jgi:hypothetical protein
MSNKRTIPEIAQRLREISAEQGLFELKELANELARRPANTRAPKFSAKMTNAIGNRVRAYHINNPNDTQAEIARHFNVNPGRVSEALAGKWSDQS